MEVSHLRASRRAHHAHLTQVFGKIAPILYSDDAPNERDTTTLLMLLEQIEAKRATLADMDTRIQATIEDADALETEILDTEEIMYNFAEKIALIKAVLARPKPLNVQAPPFQPQTRNVQTQPSTSVIQPTISEQVQSSGEDTTVSSTSQDQSLGSDNTEQTEETQAQGYDLSFMGHYWFL